MRQHGISPLALADLLEWLERVEEELKDDEPPSHWFSESGARFFETHPLTKERTARLRAATMRSTDRLMQSFAEPTLNQPDFSHYSEEQLSLEEQLRQVLTRIDAGHFVKVELDG